MAFQVDIQSKEQFLGDLVRALFAYTDINDLAKGSNTANLLEAIASSMYEVAVSSLKILQSTNLEALVGQQLDKKAESIKLPNGQGGSGRKPASQASGPVTIGSAFVKTSSKLYAGKPAPFAGSDKLYVEDASKFPTTGSVYVGRGTVDRFEGPIPYSSVTDNGSFWTIQLSTALTKSHLLSDLIVLSQGGDRTVPAGTTGQIPSSAQAPAISFTTTQDLLIADGEAEGTVNVVCTQFGEVGSALANSISTFVSAPFSGATITNPTTFKNGRSTESDEALRLRIKNYPATLSRGTKAAILAAVTGATDAESGRTIQSAVVLDPVEPGDSARVFIDDGSGLEPTFGAQAYELLLDSASGQEKRFRVAQYPVTPAVAEGSEFAPYVINSSDSLTVELDGIIETYVITPANYQNLNAATAYEIVRDLNSQSNLVGFRTLDGGRRIAMIDLSGNAEEVIVHSSNLQEVLGLPTSILRPIFVYKNSQLQSFRGKTASLETRPRNQWGISVSDLQNVRVKVDGVIVTFTVTDADFADFGTSVTTATVSQYATVFGRMIPGVKFTVSGQILVWSTRNIFSAGGTLEILETKADGSAAGWIGDAKIWKPTTSGGILAAVGNEKDYSFNRFTGEITFSKKFTANDKLEVASRDTRAHLTSKVASNGLFAVAPITGTVGHSRLVTGFDGEFLIRTTSAPAGATVTPTIPDSSGASNVLRLTANVADIFVNAEVGDWVYLIKDQATVPSWGAAIEGFYRLKSVGFNKFETNHSYSSLSASTYALSSVNASVFKDLTSVRVFATDHGLSTGDLVKVTSGALGGISSGNMSVTNVPILVIDSGTFEYTAGAAATSDASGILTTVGTNVVAVTLSAHGFESGALINTTAGGTIGGISAGNLTVTSKPIEVISTNIFRFRALAAATSQSTGSITTVVYLADTWVEFEVSAPQLTAWTPLLTAAQNVSGVMFHIFRSTVQPQLVDLGNVSSLTVDDIVATINSQIQGGSAAKLSPQQFEIRSNDFTSGSCAILAIIGNAENAIVEGVAASLQYHVGYSQSENTQAGFVVVDSVQLPTAATAGYGTRTYLKVDHQFVDILNTNSNPSIESPTAFTPVYPEGFEHLFITGRQTGLAARVYNNQTSAPYSGIMRGSKMIRALNTSDTEQTNPDTLDRYSNYGIRLRDLNVNNSDKLVVEMDLDPTDKTVAIQLSKVAKIQDIDAISGSGKGQVISFRLKDSEDGDKAFFDNTSVYKAFDFTDFKLLTKSVGLYRTDVSDRALVLRSASFGGQHRIRFSIRYPEQPGQAAVQLVHNNSYRDNAAVLTLVAILPSGSLIVGSSLNAGNYKVVSSASGTLYSMRVTSGSLNSGLQYQPGNVINISGASPIVGSYKITSAGYVSASPSANVTASSNVVTVNIVGHGLQTGDLVTILTAGTIGGISGANLSQSDTVATVINGNSFSYVAGAAATSTTSGILDNVTFGRVVFTTPGTGGITTALYSAAAAPIRSWTANTATLQDLAAAINAYFPNFPVASAEAIGTNIATNPITEPTYITYPNASAYTGNDMSGAFDWSSFACKLAGEAGIWQYDSSNATLNAIKATVQADDSIYPTTAEASGTSYTPINEVVYLVPTNTKTLQAWLNFNAASSLNLLANIERIQSDNKLQLSSKADGSAGAVRVTGVSANEITAFLEGNGTESQDASKVTILSADAKAMTRNSAVLLENDIAAEIQRPYRLAPTGTSVTVPNTNEINTFFRQTNSIKYVRMGTTTGRLIFLRDGMGDGQTEPMVSGNTVQFTNLTNGLVRITSAQGSGAANTGKLLARTGDMMYIRADASSPFTVDQRCKAIASSGQSDGANPEYIGYPVVHVIDENNVLVLAPNITNFATITLAGATAPTDLVFLPAVWNEKNIRTNHKEGALFDQYVNSGEAYFLVKSLGSGLVSVWFQNSATEATDTMRLNDLSVSTDDFAVLGTQFDPANQGTFRIVAHNGRNHMVIYNAEGGKDELIDSNSVSNGGLGDRKWRVGPIEGGFARPVRILAGECVRLNDKLRISTPDTTATQWFNNVFIGSWTITKIGYSAFAFSGALPHSYSTGSYDLGKICPYVDFEIPNAPLGVTDSLGAYVDFFVVGLNDKSIGFIEGTPYSSVRMVAGTAVSPQNAELGEVFLTPQIVTTKMASTFGSKLVALNKAGYQQRAFQGIDGYKVFTGLVREAHRIIDGLPTNTVLFPGVKAAGTVIEVLPPLIKTISASLLVRPKDGVTLNSITDLVKSTVAGYINGLDVGQPVVLSEIIREVQSLPGVFSVQILSTLPVADGDRITTSESEKAFVLSATNDIVLG